MTDPVQASTGASGEEEATGGAILRSPFILAILSVWVLFWSVTAAVVLIDPLDLYDWGEPPQLLPDYSTFKSNYLFSAATRTDADLLFIGSSTTAAITSKQLEDTFGVDRAFNLNSVGARPADRRWLLERTVEHSPASHVIVSFDWSYALPSDLTQPGLPWFLYDDDVFNDLRLPSPEVLQMTWQKLNGEPIGLAKWRPEAAQAVTRRQYKTYQAKLAKERADGTVPAFKPAIFRPASQDCADYPFVSEILPDLVERMTAEGKQVDFLIPPYSLRQFATWDARTDPEAVLAKPFLATQIAARRCLVEAVGNRENVRIFAFDNETWITGDLSNYRDEAHINTPEVYQFMLDSMAHNRNRLTPDNFENYAATLTRNIERDGQQAARQQQGDRTT